MTQILDSSLRHKASYFLLPGSATVLQVVTTTFCIRTDGLDHDSSDKGA